jgi:hypothetical protein
MMTKKTAAEVKAQVAQMLRELPEGWLDREMAIASNDPKRDVKTLEMICTALEEKATKPIRKKRATRKSAARVR